MQQKGVEHARRLKDGTVSFGLEVEKVTYYLRQLRIPIVLVVVEVSSKMCWWAPLHGNREVESDLADAVAARQESMTIHLPAANTLGNTHAGVLGAVRRMMDVLTIDAIKAMPTADARAVIESEPDLDELDRGLRLTQSLLRSTRTQRHLDRGQLDEAFQLNTKAFEDDDEAAEARFAAGMELIRIAGAMVVARGGDARERETLLKLRLGVALDLVGVCRTLASEHQLRTYSLYLARTSRLRVLVSRDVGLFFSRLAQQLEPDELAQYITAAAQRETAMLVIRELHHAQRLLLKLADRGWIGLVAYAWAEMTEALQEFMPRLKHDGLTDGAAQLRAWLDNIGTICRETVPQLHDDKLTELCALTHMRIELDNGDKAFERRRREALDMLGKITDVEVRATAEAQVEKLTKLVREKHDEAELENDEKIQEQLVRKMAHGLGLDLDDPKDKLAEIVRIGIRDINPDRVVRQCKQLLVQLGSHGIPAQMLGLPTAGTKYVSCKKHRYRTGGLSLNQIYDHFRSSHCDKCIDRDPQPADWKWTREYQRDEETAAVRMGSGRRFGERMLGDRSEAGGSDAPVPRRFLR